MDGVPPTAVLLCAARGRRQHVSCVDVRPQVLFLVHQSQCGTSCDWVLLQPQLQLLTAVSCYHAGWWNNHRCTLTAVDKASLSHPKEDPARLPCTRSLLQPIGGDGWPTGTTPAGITVRYTAQDTPISPWLTPATWTYTITQDSPWLAAVKDGVLDLSLQVNKEYCVPKRKSTLGICMHPGCHKSHCHAARLLAEATISVCITAMKRTCQCSARLPGCSLWFPYQNSATAHRPNRVSAVLLVGCGCTLLHVHPACRSWVPPR